MQPKKVKLDDRKRVCPFCGLPSARLVRNDNYLSLFFIPLVPLKKGEVYLECERCGAIFDEKGTKVGAKGLNNLPHCPNCGFEIKDDFKFCPNCGRRF